MGGTQVKSRVKTRGWEQVKTKSKLPWAVPQGAWDGILQWAFQSMARPLVDTHGLFV